MDGGINKDPANGNSVAEVEETDSLLTTSEVASLLQVHIGTVIRWNNLGILRSVRVGPRGERQFRKKDVITSMLIFKPYSLPNDLL